uniref:Uncharacterized protein n=1 Tax=Arundo donax TaxID=35708 RepID=A0A0A9FB11_ARUDO
MKSRARNDFFRVARNDFWLGRNGHEEKMMGDLRGAWLTT